MRDLSLVFFTRQGCHLCDEVRSLAFEAATRAKMGISEVDIDTDTTLKAQYTDRIPVLATSDGQVVAEGRGFESRKIRKALKRI